MNCAECGQEFIKPKRQGGNNQRFCSKKCRYKAINRRHQDYQKRWSRHKRGEYSADKVQCLICGNWYVQVGSHTYQIHKLTGREYRELMDLQVKRGIVPPWYRKLKGDQALENETYKNLEAGKQYRYIKNDPRLKLYGRGRGYKPTGGQ